MIRRKLKWKIFILFFFSCNCLVAQNRFPIVVKDSITSEPIFGATILLDQTTNSSTTNRNGLVTVTNVPDGKQIFEIKYKGYESKKISVKFPVSFIQPYLILLVKSNAKLEELVTSGNAGVISDTLTIKSHLTAITKTGKYRTHDNIDQLDSTANYIKSVFQKYADSVSTQEYLVNGRVYRNVICSFGTNNIKRVIVGAHYDVCEEQEGADDNASGVVGLLELARMLRGEKLNFRIDLVAYSLEEPPYFRTEFMGSYIHAKSLVDNNADVFGMISLEMIGYFSTDKNSQSYPIGILSFFYGHTGDYITLVKKFGAGKFARNFCSKFKSSKSIRTETFTGPPSLPGIDFSDHLNYWKFGISAMMITDTAFYRNQNYHKPSDKMETLDIKRMSKVIDGIFYSLVSL